MIRRVVVEEEADQEFVGAMRWYATRSPGLGWRFLRAVDQAIALIEKNPSLGSPVGLDIRRCLLRTFPYWLYYRVRGDELRIVACFHAKRDPEEIHSRIQ